MRHRSLLPFIFLCAASSSALAAAPSLYSGAVIRLGTYIPSANSTYMATAIEDYQWSGGLADTGDYSASFNGLDSSGDSQTTTFDARAKAFSDYGVLKAYAIATLTNPALNDANAPYVINTSFDVDPDGMPESYSSEASAYFADVITLSTNADVDYVRLSLDVSGAIGNSDYWGSTYANVSQNDGESFWSGFSTVGTLYNEGDHMQTFLTNPIPVIDGQFTFGLKLEAYADFFSVTEGMEGATATVETDFFSTLAIGHVQGFDAAGAPVGLLAAQGASGTAYAVAAVPEPETYAMFLAGLGLLGFVARRRI